jgi:acyl-CoA thioester hydrolase
MWGLGVYFPIKTSWMGKAKYGHVNNVNYYSYFDTVIIQLLIEQAYFERRSSFIRGFFALLTYNLPK